MERAYFFSGQRLSSDDLNTLTSTLSSELKNRTIDFFSKGVIGSNTDVFVLNDLNNTIKIEPFIAYSTSGERIHMYTEIRALGLDLSAENEYRLRQQGDLEPQNFGWLPNTNYDIYINYIEQPGRPKPNIKTGKFYPTRVYVGFEFYAIPVDSNQVDINTTDMVRLCRVNFTGEILNIQSSGFLEFSTVDAGKVYTKSNAEIPATYNPFSPVSMEAHIMCLGSGTPTAKNPHGYTPADFGFDASTIINHEKRMHCAGITGNRDSVTSALYIGLNSITTAQDNLIIYDLTTNEYLHSDGNWLSKVFPQGSGSMFIQFMDGTAPNFSPLPAGTYRIGINPVDGSIYIGTTSSGAGRQIILSTDSSGLNEYKRISVTDLQTYTQSNVLDLAEFSFDPTLSPQKPVSDIVNTITRSNFISKTDLRNFGSTSALELSTIKSENKDVLVLPYTLQADSLKLSNGVEITGASVLPINYINGLNIIYNTGTSITVTAGSARDSKNIKDITLTNNLTKQVNIPWAPGGLGTPVGGLMNDPVNPYLASGGITLHVFVISTEGAFVDVALDTDITGINIRNASSPTYSYKYIRRIGSVYINAEYGTTADSPALYPFIANQFGNGVWYYYTSAITLTSAVYDTQNKVFYKTFVPTGSCFWGKFNYKFSSGTNALATTLQPSWLYISGASSIDLPLSTQEIRTQQEWNFDNTLQCLGYYDGRI